jgi:pyruvate/2-oxoglutarate dehydrogenase complex dihydrolipoamide acyltransferase (E2) component
VSEFRGAAQNETLPEGQAVIMPALGMAQDTGLLVNWLKQPGDAVAADEVFFEVETDKSTMEVSAGFDGFVAAQLAAAGDNVPVGQDVAIISSAKPEVPMQRARAEATSPVAVLASREAASTAAASVGEILPDVKAQVQAKSGRILASPKARRLAHERGLDLQKLVDAGQAQPFHVSDLEVLQNMSANSQVPAAVTALRRLTAQISAVPFAEVLSYASEKSPEANIGGVISALAAGAWGEGSADLSVAYRHFSTLQLFNNPHQIALGKALPDEAQAEAHLRINDLRQSAISSIENCSDGVPTLTILGQGDQFSLIFECGLDQMSADAALSFLIEFAGRMEQPLRHLL